MLTNLLIEIIDPITKLIGEWSLEINLWSVLLRLILAALFGGAIGVERSTKRHAAGFRTYILVCVGATIAMLVNQFTYLTFGGGDTSRLGAQVISGIGFLGAGTILITSRSQVKGLTTAAGLWASACVGLAIGAGFYTAAIATGILIITSLTLLPKVEMFFRDRSKNIRIYIEFDAIEHVKDFVLYTRKNNLVISSLEPNHAYEGTGLTVYTVDFEVEIKGKHNNKEIIKDLLALPYVNYIEEII